MSNSRKTVILEAALYLFNKNGIEGISIRDIAKKVGISSGNLTYHFPTKNDIILALTNQLLAEIEQALKESQIHQSTLLTYFHQFKVIFSEQLRYEFIFNKRYGEVITSIPQMQKVVQEILPNRFEHWRNLHQELVKEKLATSSLVDDSDGHYHLINIVALFWHQEIAIYYPNFNIEEKIEHGLALVFQIYKPYLTPLGLTELSPLLKKLEPYKESDQTI